MTKTAHREANPTDTAHAPGRRILLTEGASLSARQTLYALGPLHEIDVIDPDPLCQCRFSSYVRRWTRSPSFSRHPEEFLQFLVRLIHERQYDVVLPTHEQVYLLSRFRDSLAQHVGVALPPFEALERLQNKAHFKRLLDELDLPQPEAVIVRTRADFNRAWSYPFYLKLAHSTAGSGVFFIPEESTLKSRAAELERQGMLNGNSELLAQQPARGVQATVQAVCNHGEVVGLHSFEARQLGVGGMSTARTSADHPVVREHVARIAEHLRWHGALFLDYYFDHQSGRPEYIEANPRIGETVNALLSGINLPQLLVQLSRDEAPQPAPLGHSGVRTQSFVMILMSRAHEGAGRLALMREIWRYARGRGLYEDSQDELTRPHEDRLSRLPRFWITAQLLAWPGLARRIVAKTVENYSLPDHATERIKSLPLNLLDDANDCGRRL